MENFDELLEKQEQQYSKEEYAAYTFTTTARSTN